MKIKIAYGVDMRLWRYNLTEDKPPQSSYKDLLTYVSKTFEFDDIKQFRITFKDDDDDQTTMTSQEDFEDAFAFATKSGKKSLKLYIVDSVERSIQKDEKDEKEEKAQAIQSTIYNKSNDNNKNKNSDNPPTSEEINAFLSDDFTMDLLSDLFVSIFEALQAANFEISFIECTKGVILSSNDKYIKLTTNKVWPYFMDELLPLWSVKIERFMIPMIRMNGINSDMIKQWIPTLFSMMKHHTKNDNFCGGFRGKWRHCKGGRGRGGWRGKGRHHHGGHHHRGHHGGHGHRHHHGHYRGYRGGYRGWRGRGGVFGHNYHQQNYGTGSMDGHDGYAPSAPPMINQHEDDQIEAEVFEYTEELVAIMNMGFTKMGKIKELLTQHKGNKQSVVQELVSAK